MYNYSTFAYNGEMIHHACSASMSSTRALFEIWPRYLYALPGVPGDTRQPMHGLCGGTWHRHLDVSEAFSYGFETLLRCFDLFGGLSGTFCDRRGQSPLSLCIATHLGLIS